MAGNKSTSSSIIMNRIFTILALALIILAGCDKPEGDKKDGPGEKTFEKEKTFNGIECVLIPKGTFMMGSPLTEPNRGNELFQEETISKPFYLSKYEVTVKQFAQFLNDNSASLLISKGDDDFVTIWANHPDGGNCILSVANSATSLKFLQYKDDTFAPIEGMDNYPCGSISWYGADFFCRWAGGYLPTAAQWEYACRGGQTESLPFGIGDGTKLIKGMATFDSTGAYDLSKDGEYYDPEGSALYALSPVGSYEPNGYGLYDMHGNLWEYCSNRINNNYIIMKGGAMRSTATQCRSAYMRSVFMDNCGDVMGFRIAFAAE